MQEGAVKSGPMGRAALVLSLAVVLKLLPTQAQVLNVSEDDGKKMGKDSCLREMGRAFSAYGLSFGAQPGAGRPGLV